MKTGYYVVMSFMLLLILSSCASTHFGVKDRASFVPSDFAMTEKAIAQAEQSDGAQYCPEKIAEAKKIAKDGVNTYWACHTQEAKEKLAEARRLAHEAEMCEPEPEPVGDADQDGVLDDLDRCPATPKEASVDEHGCPLDTDGDGVLDYLDKCPKTPKGTAVDTFGCPVDKDGDGVNNESDRCPDTPIGVEVDVDGCWFIKPVYFDFNKAEINPKYYPILDEVAATLKRYPRFNLEIHGHTDTVGSKEYNEELAMERADAVADYLAKYGIKMERFHLYDHYFEEPIASNQTEMGRSMNRRVKMIPKR